MRDHMLHSVWLQSDNPFLCRKPVDTAANAIAANAQQGIELSVVIEYFNCTRLAGEDNANPPMIKAIGGYALSDAVTGNMMGRELFIPLI